MCCGEKQGHQSVTVNQGVCQSGAREMCGCEEKQVIMQCPCVTESIILTLMEVRLWRTEILEQEGKNRDAGGVQGIAEVRAGWGRRRIERDQGRILATVSVRWDLDEDGHERNCC